MVDTIRIPTGALSELPGLSGVNDVVFDLPQLPDIDDVVRDIVPTVEDITANVLNALTDEAVDLVNIDDIANAVVDEIDSQTPGIFDALVDDIISGVGDELDDLEIDPGDINLDPTDLADNIADQLDVDDIDGALVSFESVFGALSDDIAAGLQQALDEVVGDVGNLPGDIDNLVDAVNDLGSKIDDIDLPGTDAFVDAIFDELVGTIPITPGPAQGIAGIVADAVVFKVLAEEGGTLLSDPDQFIDDQLNRITDGLVSDGAVDNLQASIDDIL